MFTGIIEEIGKIQRIHHSSDSCIFTISAKKILSDMHIGDSIAVNGTCLTVCRFNENSFSADVMPETVRRTNLNALRSGSPVNLERAMPANGRFGGHIVSGHIDGTGVIQSFTKEKNAVWLKISARPELLRYIVEKGSIAIDGVSLTVAEINAKTFSVSLIPHTGEETILLTKKSGDMVNLECDILAKYIEKLCKPENSSVLSESFLAEHGFY